MKTSCSANSGDMKSRSMSEEGEIHATKYSSMSEEDEIRGFPTKCLCGRLRVVLISKTKENLGRPFFRCPSFKDIWITCSNGLKMQYTKKSKMLYLELVTWK
ncbi:hypothetical protein Bca4012_042285 [Brassica carinata]|uniref:GRF-type domain-containing protein n=2 Tax=Brassica oleracea TaxID=3712 RepID=A0A0D3E4K0_BRAOL|nr:unnamed protein product [Brassica oleracea]